MTVERLDLAYALVHVERLEKVLEGLSFSKEAYQFVRTGLELIYFKLVKDLHFPGCTEEEVYELLCPQFIAELLGGEKKQATTWESLLPSVRFGIRAKREVTTVASQ